jgi:hypothetical protein
MGKIDYKETFGSFEGEEMCAISLFFGNLNKNISTSYEVSSYHIEQVISV